MAEIRNILMRKPVTGWAKLKKANDIEEETGKEVVSVIIGDITYTDGTKDFAIEPVYEDILRKVYEAPGEYRICPLPGNVPQMFITRFGDLQIHNNTMRLFADAISEAFDACSDRMLLCRALKDATGKAQKGSTLYALNELSALLSRTLEVNLPAEFIKAALKNYFTNLYAADAENDALAQTLSALEWPELLDLSFELNEMYHAEGQGGPVINRIVDETDASDNDIFTAVQRELFVRSVTGRVGGKK